MPEQRVGVAGIDVEETIRVGDKIRIAGHTTDLEQVVESMEIDGQRVMKQRRAQRSASK